MRVVWVAGLVLAMVGGTASASMFEDLTGLHYQSDGGTERDAPDTCQAAIGNDHVLNVTVPTTLNGILVPKEDEVDNYVLNVTPELLFARVHVRVRGADLNFEVLNLDVQLPECGGSVFDPATFEQQQQQAQQQSPQPTEPPAGGEKTIGADSLTGYACDSTHWHFILNQVGRLNPAPDHIRVQWSNGDIENISATKDTPATVAHYDSTLNLDSPVWAAHANVFATWDGKFNLGSGPCNGPATEPPAPAFQPPLKSAAAGEFTVTDPRPHVVTVIYRETHVPTSVPASCHELCQPALNLLGVNFGYELFGDNSQSDN